MGLALRGLAQRCPWFSGEGGGSGALVPSRKPSLNKVEGFQVCALTQGLPSRMRFRGSRGLLPTGKGTGPGQGPGQASAPPVWSLSAPPGARATVGMSVTYCARNARWWLWPPAARARLGRRRLGGGGGRGGPDRCGDSDLQVSDRRGLGPPPLQGRTPDRSRGVETPLFARRGSWRWSRARSGVINFFARKRLSPSLVHPVSRAKGRRRPRRTPRRVGGLRRPARHLRPDEPRRRAPRGSFSAAWSGTGNRKRNKWLRNVRAKTAIFYSLSPEPSADGEGAAWPDPQDPLRPPGSSNVPTPHSPGPEGASRPRTADR